MKLLDKLCVLLVLVTSSLIFPSESAAQTMQSEDGVLKQTISGTEVTIEYSRPSVRGREPLFGGLEKWGHTWTPGEHGHNHQIF